MVVVLLSGTVLAVLNQTLLTPALPAIMEDLSVDAPTAQWLTSGYSLVEAVVIPLSAFLMGRIPTRRLFIGGISLFALGSLMGALAPSFGFLLAGRVVQAACTGAMLPMVSSLVLLVIPRERRGTAMGLIGLVIGFAPAVGPTLSGILVDHVGWRVLFAIVTALSAIVALVALKTLENYGEFEPTKFDAPSVILSTVGLVSLLYGFSTFGSTDTIALSIGLVIFGLVVVGLYVKRQLSLEQPMLRLDILKTRQYRTAVIIIALFQAGLVGMETIVPLYIQGVLGYSATVSGMALLPGAVISGFIGLLAGRVFDRRGVRFPALLGCAFLTLSVAGLLLIRMDFGVAAIAIVYTLLPFGVQFAMTPLNTWGVNSLRNEDVRYAQSTSNTVNQVAGSFGTALLVSVASAVASAASSQIPAAEAAFAGYRAAFGVTAGLLAIAIACIVLLVREKKVEVSDATVLTPADSGRVLVADAMNADAVQVPVTATMGEVIRVMSGAESSGAAVVDEQGRLVGFVSDGDVARYFARRDIDVSSALFGVLFHRDEGDIHELLAEFSGLNVMSVAVKKVVSVEADMPLGDACKILSDRRIMKAPVVRNGKLVGALSRRNIMRYTISQID